MTIYLVNQHDQRKHHEVDLVPSTHPTTQAPQRLSKWQLTICESWQETQLTIVNNRSMKIVRNIDRQKIKNAIHNNKKLGPSSAMGIKENRRWQKQTMQWVKLYYS